MASTVCGYCGRFTHMTRVWADYVAKEIPATHLVGVGMMPARLEHTLQAAMTCDNCHRVSVAYRVLADSETPGPHDTFLERGSLSWHPLRADAPSFPDVPPHIASAAEEAHTARAVGAPMAAILMARTVVEATAKDRGITTGSLVVKIDAMAEADLVRASTRDAAHEIRHFGNDMAHGDISDQPSDDDVSDVLSLMDEVLNEVFQGPARTARVRARREGAPTEA